MVNPQKRYVGLDVHKHYVMVGAVNRSQEMVLPPRKVSLAEFEGWAKKHLRSTDEVVLEATTNAWYLHDLLEPLVARVVVCHPPQVKLIAAALVKTDKKDTMTLAKLLAVGMIPPVWVPPVYVRELRALINHRQRLIAQQTRTKNRLRSLLQRHHLVPPDGDLFSEVQRTWWNKLKLNPSEKLRARQDLIILDQLLPLIAEVETEIGWLSLTEPWAEQTPYLLQLLGIGLITAMTILSAIGEIERFPTAKKLVGYAGLGTRIHSSGQTHRTGGITKQGRKELRAVLVEAAWIAVRYDHPWREQFDRLADRLGRQKAIVAIARKLLVIIWHVLTTQMADRRAEPQQVARYFITWGRQLRVKTLLGIKASEFARQQLDRLELGQELERVPYGSVTYCLPPSTTAT
ncbi:MAG: IS110 family transposase [Anaerolineales bacterium]|nr:IS110 family transposase [Anaerolineales bacterium]